MFKVFLIGIPISYLIGSISFAYLTGKLLKGIDLREFGSGNLGSTNTIRILGKGPGIVVQILDILKGFIPVYLITQLGRAYGVTGESLVILQISAGMTAILGHIYTLFLNFQGGKGVNTAAGVFLYLAPGPIIIAALVFLMVFYTTRYVSLGSILAAISLPLIMVIQKYGFSCNISPTLLGFSSLISLLIIAKHKSNIKRLLAGTENKFEKKAE
jgi:glycerol-3-phosphate acyltransferase PlsY